MFLPRAVTYLGVIRHEELINTWIEEMKKQGIVLLDSPRSGSIYAVNPIDPSNMRTYDRQGVVDSAPQWLPTIPPKGDVPA